MRFTVKDISTVKKTFLIEIQENDVTAQIDKTYGELKNKVKIKGFRQGKIPRSIIEKFHQKNINEDVMTALISETLPEVVKKSGFTVLSDPYIKRGSLEKKQPYKYEVVVEIEPKIEHIDFSGLKLKRSVYTLSDNEIEAQMEMLKKNAATYEKIEEDRAAVKDDFILIDYEAFQDGKPFKKFGKEKDFKMQIGDSKIFNEFNENLVGMKINEEKDININFPKNYQEKSFAGKLINFKITMKEIRKEILPELNDEFVKKYGEYNSVDELKSRIRKNLQQGYNKRTEQEINEQIFTSLIERTDFELPECLVSFELNNIVEDAERTFAYYNTSIEKLGRTKEQLAEQYQGLAEKQARRHLILNHIIKQEKPELSDETLENAYKENAERTGISVEQLKKYYENNKKNFEYFKQTLLEKATINLIIGKSEIEEIQRDSKLPTIEE